jgi:hypothetical protein
MNEPFKQNYKQTRFSFSHLFQSVFFIAILVLLLVFATALVRPVPDRQSGWSGFLQQPKNSIDLLLIGNSHVYSTFLPLEAWKEAGVASWDLGAGRISNSVKLAYLKEALRTQKPRVVAVELFGITTEQFPDGSGETDPRTTEWSYSEMPFGVNKVKSVFTSLPATEVVSSLVPLIRYHNRYADITEDATWFLHAQAKVFTGGGYLRVGQGDPNGPKTKPRVATAKQYQASLSALEEIIALCKREHIPLVLWTAPMWEDPVSDFPETIQRDLRAKHLDEGVTFVNMVDEMPTIGIDNATSFLDSGHLSYEAATKATNWLLEEVFAPYNLPDHREEPSYKQWQKYEKSWDKRIAKASKN